MCSGHIDACGLESARRELLAADAVESLRVARATASETEAGASVLSAELIALDAQLTGLRRERYLRALTEKARGEYELLECRFGEALVGYSLMIELRRAYWIALVRICAL